MFVGMLLPWLELLVGACLLGGIFVSGALLASMGMGVLFTFVLASALWRHLDISCGCFGSAGIDKISYLTLIRAGVITLFSTVAYIATILGQPDQGEPRRVSLQETSQAAHGATKPGLLLTQGRLSRLDITG
jgi:hypothetical protein